MNKNPLIPIGTVVLTDNDELFVAEINGHSETYTFPSFDFSEWGSLTTPQPLYVKALAYCSVLFMFGDAQDPTCFLASQGKAISNATLSDLIDTFRPRQTNSKQRIDP